LLKAPTAEGRDLLGSQLSGFDTLAERMTAVNDWAVSSGQGFVSGFPNYYDGQAQFVKALAIKPEAAVFQDLPLSGATFEDRYRAANKAASDLKMGYSGAFLTGFQADYGSGLVYGCILLKQGPTEWRDVLAADLKFTAGTTQELFLAVDGWATQNGFVVGLPTLYYAGDGPSRVYGTILFSQDAATVVDVSISALVDIGDIASYFRSVNTWATKQQFVGASPAFASDNSGPIYGAVLIHQGFGEWNDIPMAQLVFP
jgi:hypothetical protein